MMDLDKLEYPKDAEFPYEYHDTGKRVTAKTLHGNPWDIEGLSDDPYEVRGRLFIRPSPFGGYQCSVQVEEESKDRPAGEDVDVDPSTVEEIGDD